MDTYRVSDANLSMINRSYVSQGRVRSNIESVIDYQNSQTKLFKLTLILLVIMVGACLLLIGHVFFNRGVSRVQEVDTTSWSTYDKIKYTFFNIVPSKNRPTSDNQVKDPAQKSESGFFDHLKDLWPLDKGCGHLQKFEQKLKAQRFSVQRHIENLPNYDHVKNNRSQYEISAELSQSCLADNLEATKLTFDGIMGSFDRIVGIGHLDLNSTPDDFTTLTTQIHDDENRYKEAERLLDNEFIYGVKANVNDLVNSHKNLQEKKVLLNGYRFNLFNHMKQLENTINEIKVAKQASDDQKAQEINLNNRLGEAGALVHKYEELIKQKEASMGKKEQNELAELRQMDDRIDEIKTYIVNAERIRTECHQKRDRISKNQNNISDIESRSSHIQSEIDKLQHQRKDKDNAFKNLADANELYENRKTIHAIKLEVLLRNKEIKEFLEKLINSKTNMDNLTNLMDSKISNEEKLILLMNEYNEDSAKIDAMEGRTVVDQETVTSDSLKGKIEKDREDFKRIMEKYIGLKKVVDEYEDPDLEIHNLKVKIQDISERKDKNLDEQKRLKNEIDKLDKQINSLEDQLRNLNDKRNSIQISIDQDDNYIKEKESSLDDAERKLKDLQVQKSVLDDKYKVSSIGDQRKVRN